VLWRRPHIISPMTPKRVIFPTTFIWSVRLPFQPRQHRHVHASQLQQSSGVVGRPIIGKAWRLRKMWSWLRSTCDRFMGCVREGEGGLANRAYVHAIRYDRSTCVMCTKSSLVIPHHLLTPSNLRVKPIQQVKDQADLRNACRWSHSELFDDISPLTD
jgi:hypothetical protein